jgi:glycosyltransferase involved in cell wall biosynthesis
MKGDKPNILYISYDFPPILSPESIQAGRTAKYLFLRGWGLYVLASEERPVFEKIDPELMKFVPKGLEIVRSLPYRSQLLAKMVQVHHALLKVPDRKRGWVKRALPLGLNLFSKKRPVLLYSHANPLTCHLLGLKLKQMTGLPWVAHFSDPWIDNPYFNYRDPIRKRLNERLEQLVFHHADACIFTTEETQKIYIGKYPGKKYDVIPHSFDPDTFQFSLRPDPQQVLQFVHTGSVYGLRTPAPLFQGIREFIKENPRARSLLEFLFVGKFDRKFRPLVEEFGLNDVVKIEKGVSYLESLYLLKKANVLLLLEAPDEVASVFLPSKLVDYIGVGKPILAITPGQGPTARIIRKAGFFSADPLRPHEIVEVLEKIWQGFQSGKIKGIPSEVQTEFTGEVVVQRLEKIFFELISS